nr:discoidin domain-containing protein [Pseudoxanthomonas dokdonensis]
MVVVLVLPLLATSTAAIAAQPVRLLDGFEDTGPWRVVTSNQVSGSLRQIEGVKGNAICLDYNFNGVSGYAGLQRDLALEYPDNYAFEFQLQGAPAGNDLQFKLADASGDNVWWVNRPHYDFPPGWTPVRYKQRHIDKAWGPDPERTLRRSAKLEFTIYNQTGGKGSVCFDQLTLTALPPQDNSPLTGVASASGQLATFVAANAVDGDQDTAWYADFAATPNPQLTLDLGKPREFGGLVLSWARGQWASDYLLQTSLDGEHWLDVRTVVDGNGGKDYIALPESEARYIRLDAIDGPQPALGLAELQVQPLAFSAHPNDFIKAVAADAPKGWYPRGFSGEQPYWTIVGLDGGHEQGLIGEDGAIEVGKGGFSIEPFVLSDGRLIDWAGVKTRQSLLDGYLPIPSVQWLENDLALQVTSFVQGTADNAQLVARYRLSNTGSTARQLQLALALRPLQVNPPSQFLNTIGGVSRIEQLQMGEQSATVNGQARLYCYPASDQGFASSFDAGMAVQHLADGDIPRQSGINDATGLASAAWLYNGTLAPGQSREVTLVVPQTGDWQPPATFDAAAAQERVARQWRDKLDQVRMRVPAQGQAFADTVRTATAHMLISRVGPRLQPGTRSYSRSWIRDGAMISEGLLRMGRSEVVKDYLDWYAPYQFDDGMVPCCVDQRGSDPVPENDSHGELIFNIAEYYRYSGDRAFLQRMWPHVRAAYDYMESLRLSERTEQNRARNPAFYGMMPVSISHEGYSAKPMHSYWDNFWALRGYKDAVDIAQWLGKPEQAQVMAASRDQFRDDLDASLRAAASQHGIDYLPGAAELGDFDATSTTIALAPGGEQGRLPAQLLNNTFERYWQQFQQRRDGQREWKDYTPYEWRNVSAFVRLGWRERAGQAVDFFFKDRAPAAWNQWGEVVSRTPRTPFFLGDLPHAWVASDFVRAALDMFAYVREVDDSIVLAAGVPADWISSAGGVAISGLRTPYGRLDYALQADARQLQLRVEEGMTLPAGGLVLPWPLAGTPADGRTLVNGKPAQWQEGELRIHALPAEVSVQLQP